MIMIHYIDMTLLMLYVDNQDLLKKNYSMITHYSFIHTMKF